MNTRCKSMYPTCPPTAHGETEPLSDVSNEGKGCLDELEMQKLTRSASKICVTPEATTTIDQNVTEIFGRQKNLVDILKKIIDFTACGLQVVNKQGILVYVNESFKEMQGVREEDVIGRHVTEVVRNTRMHLVAQTGIPEHDRCEQVFPPGLHNIVSRIPIFEANECIGAVGFIRFRYTDDLLKLTSEIKRLQKQIYDMRKEKDLSCGTEYSFENILEVSEPMRHAKSIAMQAASTNATVLLRGESGVGKEVFAHSIHNFGQRRRGPFIRVNCGAIQENLIESELFGYEEGAFTGARKGGRKGRFEQAEGGTIFLDEIGDMPLAAQVKLLRVIQEGEVDRLGSEKRNQVDVRIIAATNRNLEDKVRDGSFREDLFYRLNVIPILIPPLRQIPEDIPWLIKNLWERLSRRHGIYHKRLSQAALSAMQMLPWKGNVREMQNVLERLMIMCKADEIGEEELRRVLLQGGACCDLIEIDGEESSPTLDILVGRTERRAIRYALAVSKGNRSAAAKLLGISRPLLYKKLAKYDLV